MAKKTTGERGSREECCDAAEWTLDRVRSSCRRHRCRRRELEQQRLQRERLPPTWHRRRILPCRQSCKERNSIDSSDNSDTLTKISDRNGILHLSSNSNNNANSNNLSVQTRHTAQYSTAKSPTLRFQPQLQRQLLFQLECQLLLKPCKNNTDDNNNVHQPNDDHALARHGSYHNDSGRCCRHSHPGRNSGSSLVSDDRHKHKLQADQCSSSPAWLCYKNGFGGDHNSVHDDVEAQIWLLLHHLLGPADGVTKFQKFVNGEALRPYFQLDEVVGSTAEEGWTA
mmetsp:Transcript_4956/g.11820  ORF Transcript_4956/g.11820 Transcript_4956/m.11820 type:complete len:283 (+) Transcript_4956:3065-3913(+)